MLHMENNPTSHRFHFIMFSPTKRIRFIRLSNYRTLVTTHSINKPGLLDFDLVKPDTQSGLIPPIIFLHGLLGNRKNNRSASRELSKNLNTSVVIPDLRNHGTSFHLAPHNNYTMSKDLDHLIHYLQDVVGLQGSENFILIGHSMGGKVALSHGLTHPDVIKGIITIDNIPYTTPERALFEFEKFHIWLNELRELTETKGFSKSMTELREGMKRVVDSGPILDFLLSNFGKSNKTGRIESKVPLSLLNQSVENLIDFKLQRQGDLDNVGQYDHPLLIIRADYSEFIGKDLHGHEVDKYFTNWEVQDIASGHWVISEKRRVFVKMATDWILKHFQG